MEEKVNEINEFVKNLKNNAHKIPNLGLNSLAGFLLACDDIIAFIDSLEKKHESNTVWHGKDEKPDFGIPILVIDCFGQPYSGYYNGINPRMVENWAYIKDLVDCKERHFGDKNEMVSEDLEEEYEKYFKEHETDIVLNPYSNCKDIAQHFAEWQKQKDEQKSKVLFEKSLGDCSKELIDIIDKEFGIDGRDENDNPLNGFGDWKCGMILNGPAISKLVKLGIEWQKQQMKEALQTEYEKGRFDMSEGMMKEAIDATILDIDAQTIEFGLWPEKLLDMKEGDKAKIIIVKEEKK